MLALLLTLLLLPLILSGALLAHAFLLRFQTPSGSVTAKVASAVHSHQPLGLQRVSVVITNCRRSANVVGNILPALVQYASVAEVVVSHVSAEAVESASEFDHPKVRHRLHDARSPAAGSTPACC